MKTKVLLQSRIVMNQIHLSLQLINHFLVNFISFAFFYTYRLQIAVVAFYLL